MVLTDSFTLKKHRYVYQNCILNDLFKVESYKQRGYVTINRNVVILITSFGKEVMFLVALHGLSVCLWTTSLNQL